MNSSTNTAANPFIPVYNRIWKTKGSRYNAYRRLKRRNERSLSTIALLSIFVLSINIWPLFPSLTVCKIAQDINTFFSILLSIIILFISLVEASHNFLLKAERHHSCANELLALYNRVCSSKDNFDLNSGVDLGVYLKERDGYWQAYDAIIMKYNENHDTLDYHKFLIAENVSEKLSRYNKISVPIRYALYPYQWDVFTVAILAIYISIICFFASVN